MAVVALAILVDVAETAEAANTNNTMSNTFGNILRLTTWGESHGAAIGGVIDGFPSQVSINLSEINAELQRRSTGVYACSSQRKEPDVVEILSGLKDGVTLGTPIAFMVRNTDARSGDYDELEHNYRPSHADYTYNIKYGTRDHRGGGRTSARETVARVVAGAMAKQWLATQGVRIAAYTAQIGEVKSNEDSFSVDDILNKRCATGALTQASDELMTKALTSAKESGDSLGGIVKCVIEGLPVGVGEPVFDKLQACLAHAMLSLPACKGFDYGSGFEDASKLGSELVDEMEMRNGKVKMLSNNSGGIQGGISNGETVFFRTVFKPIATMSRELRTVIDSGENVMLKSGGLHDVSVFTRILPIVESMAAIVFMDNMLITLKS